MTKMNNKEVLKTMLTTIGDVMPKELLDRAMNKFRVEGCYFCGEPKDKEMLDWMKKHPGLAFSAAMNHLPCESCKNAIERGLILMTVVDEEDPFWFEAAAKWDSCLLYLKNAQVMCGVTEEDVKKIIDDPVDLETVMMHGFFIVPKNLYEKDEFLMGLVDQYGNCYNLPDEREADEEIVDGIIERNAGRFGG